MTAAASLTPPSVSEAELESVERALLTAWLRPLTPAQLGASRDALSVLRARDRAVRVSGELYMHARALACAHESVLELLERDGKITLAGFRDALAVSRKSAQALLEHFDGARVTRRLPDDSRVPFRRAGVRPQS